MVEFVTKMCSICSPLKRCLHSSSLKPVLSVWVLKWCHHGSILKPVLSVWVLKWCHHAPASNLSCLFECWNDVTMLQPETCPVCLSVEMMSPWLQPETCPVCLSVEMMSPCSSVKLVMPVWVLKWCHHAPASNLSCLSVEMMSPCSSLKPVLSVWVLKWCHHAPAWNLPCLSVEMMSPCSSLKPALSVWVLKWCHLAPAWNLSCMFECWNDVTMLRPETCPVCFSWTSGRQQALIVHEAWRLATRTLSWRMWRRPTPRSTGWSGFTAWRIWAIARSWEKSTNRWRGWNGNPRGRSVRLEVECNGLKGDTEQRASLHGNWKHFCLQAWFAGRLWLVEEVPACWDKACFVRASSFKALQEHDHNEWGIDRSEGRALGWKLGHSTDTGLIPQCHEGSSPRVGCHVRSLAAFPQPLCACINICAHVKNPKHWLAATYPCLDAWKYCTHW